MARRRHVWGRTLAARARSLRRVRRRRGTECAGFTRHRTGASLQPSRACTPLPRCPPQASFRTIKTISECLADEIINASKGSSNSYAIKKKDEVERVAKANR